jgi:3',5'-cyclic AMP phosphodiesterase CpdA
MPSTKRRTEAVRVCHLSDLHLPLRDGPRPHELANKRLLGWLNLKLNRGGVHRRDVLEGLLAGVAGERADLHVVTGDLTSLALGRELREMGALLGRFGLTPENTVIVPGNHDRYTISADLSSAFERGFAEFTEGDVGRTRHYPHVRIVGPVALAALDTAVWRGPVRAAGRLDPAQADRLGAFLDGPEAKGLWPVIAMHHPPFRLAGDRMRDYRVGLEGREHLARALAGHHGTLLHGHLHLLSRRAVDGFDAIGVPSASHVPGEPARQAAYHVYSFDRAGLLDATVVRYDPEGGGRFERAALPQEA